MGNRAVVTFANRDEMEPFAMIRGGRYVRGFVNGFSDKKVGVYLHWNGGLDSVSAFCNACRELGFRGPASDCYGVARFAQLVCNFFGGTSGLCVGVDILGRLDCHNGDNGVYIVDDHWTIVGREFAPRCEQAGTDAEIAEMTDYLVRIQRGLDGVINTTKPKIV